MLILVLVLFAVGLALWAIWCSGRQVGYDNARREAEAHKDDELEPTIYMVVDNTKGDADNDKL